MTPIGASCAVVWLPQSEKHPAEEDGSERKISKQASRHQKIILPILGADSRKSRPCNTPLG
jgi:hypothetical protein